jgi:hypothetical protein
MKTRTLLSIIAVLLVILLGALVNRARAQILMTPVALYSPAGYQQLVSSTVTITIASPGVVTLAAHGFIANQGVVFSNTGGNLPTGITAGTEYFVIPLTSSTFEIAATPNGAPINTSGTQLGTQSVQPVTLAPPAGGARVALICAEAQNIRWRDDGVLPTTTVGMLIATITGGQLSCIFYACNISAFSFTPATAGGILNVSYYR